MTLEEYVLDIRSRIVHSRLITRRLESFEGFLPRIEIEHRMKEWVNLEELRVPNHRYAGVVSWTVERKGSKNRRYGEIVSSYTNEELRGRIRAISDNRTKERGVKDIAVTTYDLDKEKG